MSGSHGGVTSRTTYQAKIAATICLDRILHGEGKVGWIGSTIWRAVWKSDDQSISHVCVDIEHISTGLSGIIVEVAKNCTGGAVQDLKISSHSEGTGTAFER